MLIFAIPALVAFVLSGLDWDWRNGAIPRVQRHHRYNPIPTAWDFAAPRLGDCFIRVTLPGDRYLGGWMGAKSYLSTYPEARDIYIDLQWRLDGHGNFLEEIAGTRGVYISLTDVQAVEWLDAPELSRGFVAGQA